MPTGSTLHFRVRIGSKFAVNPVLLVNLPLESDAKAASTEESKVEAQEESKSGSQPANGGSGETLINTSGQHVDSQKRQPVV